MIYADELIGGEACRQPCQDPFFIMSLQMETELEEMVFVGDNPLVDFVAPRQLGMMTVRVQRPDGSHLSDEPPNPAYAPDIVIPSLFELADVLQEIECPLI
jgi:FMN phosphatase YigB (HAD superfamily)